MDDIKILRNEFEKKSKENQSHIERCLSILALAEEKNWSAEDLQAVVNDFAFNHRSVQ
ncbi:hypothetical protein LSG31_00705 [Fodinisporobacter ferrooxydans]|uniref:Uncharacterized protein n=1 Tax=Fodinisporobacter ferrooxydans TaxID=2901836 RepID=A0ABY4CJZ1_9BACL|nr:hypothetical protein LSG31_00705 [Alicyclobacillaceae bacterium MYW30-H2]